MALISPADVRAHRQGYTSDSDDAILRAIRVAESQIARWLGWPPASDSDAVPSMASTSRTVLLHGPMRRYPSTLQLPFFPIVSVTSVAQWGGASYSDTVAAGEYTIVPMQGRIRLDLDATTTWLVGDRRIRVVVVAGWTADSVPDDLADGIARLAAHVMTVGRGSRAESTSRAGSTVTYRPTKIPADVRQLIAPYRLPVSLGLGIRALAGA